MEKTISIRHLTKRYGIHRGIENVSLQVEKGDIFGFLGPNGAGKSTTIRSMLGMLRFQEGEIRLLGMSAPEQQKAILQRTGYLPSEVMFYPSMRVGEVISLAAKIRGQDCTKEAERLCNRLEVDLKKRVSELSLGNRKKVGIVCAMQHQPELLVMDEPTSGLDPLMQEVFFELVQDASEQGVTCFLSSHVLPEVKRYCRNAAIIREGKLVRVDSVENLVKSNLRRVKVTRKLSDNTLQQLPGVSDYSEREGTACFSYGGDMERLLTELQGVSVQDLLIEEPSLGETFMHFYEEGVSKR